MAAPGNATLEQYNNSVTPRPEAPRPGATLSSSSGPSQEAAGAGGASSANDAAATTRQLSAPRRLQALLGDVDRSFALHEEAAEIILQLVEEFASSVAKAAATAARHRGSPAIEQKDVAFALLKQWNMAVPAVGVGVGGWGGGDADGGGSVAGGGGKKGGGKRKR